jgi:putative addiction module CopG family antidote
MASQSFPPDVGQFVDQQLAAGRYQSEAELVVDAVRVLRDLEAHQRQFCREVQEGIDQLERGEVHQYDEQGLRNRFEEPKGWARQRIENRREDR